LQLWKLKFTLCLIEQAKAMRSYENKTALTLIEMLIVVAIVVVLTTMVIGIAGRINDQSNEQLTRNTIGIITAALRQFRDYKYRYEAPIYSGFDFPLDCNDFPQSGIGGIEMTLGNALGATVVINGGIHDIRYSGSEVLYFLLSQVSECRKTLDKIDESLLTNLGSDQQPRRVTITYPGGIIKEYPLFRIIDPWGTTLKYDYYYELEPDPILRQRGKKTFPVITSAGPDRKFGNTDDISSRK
jgi:type II secretory pathway pseudopilin PulG